MIKLGTIGMIDKNAKSFPYVKAHADIQNGWVGTFNGDVTVAPTVDTVKSADLAIALNTITGDKAYMDNTITSGDYVNMFSLKQWAGQTLEVSAIHLAAALSTYAEGDILVADASGKFVEGVATGYGVSFVVVKKTTFCGGGIIVKIVA